MATAVPIIVESFDTEAFFDYLTVNGLEYSGTSGPDGVTPTGSMMWSSDFTVQSSGWRLCVALPPTPARPPTPAPPPTPVPQHMWAAIVGKCTLEGTCVQSANYPQNYSADEYCAIEIDMATAVPII
eukprot:6271937-Pyramimonas_sp.AAC.1